MSATTTSLNAALSGRYEIEREIGRGGMATVYLARDVKHARNVALKVLDPELGAVLGAERFLSEIRVTANLQHPNLLPLFDSGEANGLLFYVMPFIEGESLRARLEHERQLPIDDAVRIATAVAGALDYAHGHGVIHRDLKPENILLQHGQPVVADFGIALAVSKAGGARVTQTGLSLGTPQYMSPEQAGGPRAVMTGSVRRAGEQLHVSAELASTSNDSVMWSFSVDRTWPSKYIPPELVARLPAALGDTATMYKWLERGLTARSAWAVYLATMQLEFTPHRAEPHFQSILARAGLKDAGTSVRR